MRLVRIRSGDSISDLDRLGAFRTREVLSFIIASKKANPRSGECGPAEPVTATGYESADERWSESLQRDRTGARPSESAHEQANTETAIQVRGPVVLAFAATDAAGLSDVSQ